MNIFLLLWKKCSFILLFVFLILGFFNPVWAIAASLCMVTPILTSIFIGRFWCGNLCPRGSFYDNVLSRLSNNKPVPWLLRSRLFRYPVVVLVLSVFYRGIQTSNGDIVKIGMVFYRMIVITTLIGIILSLFYNERTWCNFCPMGTLSNLFCQLNDNRKTLKVNYTCCSCRLCSKSCPMGIKPYKFKGRYLDHPDCIQCRRCNKVCPKHSIK